MSDEGNKDQRPGARSSVFLERQSYRRRRLTDAARLLPFLGALLFALPLLWPDRSSGDVAVPLSSAIFYVFVCWGALIVIGLIFGFAARRIPTPEDQDTGVE
ncbi:MULTISPECIES: hypothetical protein [unclassified Ruegeria]|uniref:hypothetical protein n=1 Tax=unclassified Ruegeria TaxID=2625375 RepID=UPI001489A63E|nr:MULTISPECIES: hypothetical protein [unclassified Ruegeria]NOD62703.1 hypothetical protein [Ruegeria sp. HKCCD6109]